MTRSGDRNDRDFERLRAALEQEPFFSLFRHFRGKNAIFSRFGSWRDLVVFMHDNVQNSGKEDVFNTIFQAYAEGRDPSWAHVLLVLFWPGLRSLQARKHSWDEDQERFWHNIVATFLEVIARLDPVTRRSGYSGIVLWRTFHNLYRIYESRWARLDHEALRDPDDLDGEFPAVEPEQAEKDLNLAWQVKRLQELRISGLIDETEFLLIVGSYLYGTPLRDCATEVGLTYEGAKKRRQRALDAIRRSWKK